MIIININMYINRDISADLEAAKSLFTHSCLDQPLAGGTGGFVFAEDLDEELRNKIFKEFNSLAVIYGATSNQFIEDKYQLVSHNVNFYGRSVCFAFYLFIYLWKLNPTYTDMMMFICVYH
jgi:hypothetical protein